MKISIFINQIDSDLQSSMQSSNEESAPYEVIRCESQNERNWRQTKCYSERSPSKMPANLVAPPEDDDTGWDGIFYRLIRKIDNFLNFYV